MIFAAATWRKFPACRAFYWLKFLPVQTKKNVNERNGLASTSICTAVQQVLHPKVVPTAQQYTFISGEPCILNPTRYLTIQQPMLRVVRGWYEYHDTVPWLLLALLYASSFCCSRSHGVGGSAYSKPDSGTRSAEPSGAAMAEWRACRVIVLSPLKTQRRWRTGRNVCAPTDSAPVGGPIVRTHWGRRREY